MVERQALDLVQRQQDLDQKLLVLHLQRQGETVDDTEIIKSEISIFFLPEYNLNIL